MKQLNRWVYAIVGVIVLLFAGLVYAWSVLSTPIGAEFTGWTKAQLSLTFTLVMILFCIGSLLCGLLAGKLSAKNAVRLGAVLFLAGFFIASRCQSPLTLYLGFGVLCGLGLTQINLVRLSAFIIFVPCSYEFLCQNRSCSAARTCGRVPGSAPLLGRRSGRVGRGCR